MGCRAPVAMGLHNHGARRSDRLEQSRGSLRFGRVALASRRRRRMRDRRSRRGFARPESCPAIRRRRGRSIIAAVYRAEMHGHDHEHDEQRSGATGRAAEWDARYSERDGTMWSGRPNGRLVAEVDDLPPGRALDVGCGEGADAIWLARRGWTVTAIDISEVAVRRAQEAAEKARV